MGTVSPYPTRPLEVVGLMTMAFEAHIALIDLAGSPG
jgi:hypothetical protein